MNLKEIRENSSAVFIPLNWELAFSGMVCADAAISITQARIRELLQKDGTLSFIEGVSEITQTSLQNTNQPGH